MEIDWEIDQKHPKAVEYDGNLTIVYPINITKSFCDRLSCLI